MTKQEKAAAKRQKKLRSTILSHPSNSPLASQLKTAVLTGRL